MLGRIASVARPRLTRGMGGGEYLHSSYGYVAKPAGKDAAKVVYGRPAHEIESTRKVWGEDAGVSDTLLPCAT